MHNLYNSLVGSVSFALLRPRTKWALKNSIWLTVLFIQTILMEPSGYSVTNARTLTTSTVSVQIWNKTSSGPSCVDFWNVTSDRPKRVIKRVIKRVTIPVFSVPGPKQKNMKKRRGKDGRVVGQRRAASAGKGKREQLWTEEDMAKVFSDWEENKNQPKHLQKSIRQISMDRGVPYTTCCERLMGRRGGGKPGKIAGGKRTGKILDKGERVTQAGNFNRFRVRLPA